MYHYVHDQDPLARPGSPGVHEGLHGVTVTDFTAQIERLCGFGEPIDWPTLYAWMSGRCDIPDRCFLLTFDDGLADHAETVLPILQDRGLRGVFFVPAAVLTGHRMLPAHQIHLLLSMLGDEGLEEELRTDLSNFDAGREWLAWLDHGVASDAAAAAAEAMYDYEEPIRAQLKHWLTMVLPIDVRTKALDALFERHIGSSTRWSRHWYLGWDDLIRMRSLGHTIGGHGYAHEPYARLTPAERRADLLRAAAVLREGLGSEVRPLSYPYGSVPDDIEGMGREAGFVQGFTTQRAWLTEDCDPLRLPRVDTIHVDAVIHQEPACSPT
jgi:peptidoglycan/xylan/chitin deacetylase (PgdA/CDA1 family)